MISNAIEGASAFQRKISRLALLSGCAFLLLAPESPADVSAGDKFFRRCPHRGRIQLHDERNSFDLHAIMYTALSASEIELLRLADWLVDLPLPGQPIRPLQRTAAAIHAGYHWLPQWLIVRRAGEFVDALQIAQISLGDVATTYSAAAGDARGPGSGMIVRINKLIDWMQHIGGDVNQFAGQCLGSHRGLLPGSIPTKAVDATQWLIVKVFHKSGILVAKAIEAGISGLEITAEVVVNTAHSKPHKQTTAFLRLPFRLLRAYELWFLENRKNIVLCTEQDIESLDHAALAHQLRVKSLYSWSELDRFSSQDTVIVLTKTNVISRAPELLKSYVVPIEWLVDK